VAQQEMGHGQCVRGVHAGRQAGRRLRAACSHFRSGILLAVLLLPLLLLLVTLGVEDAWAAGAVVAGGCLLEQAVPAEGRRYIKSTRTRCSRQELRAQESVAAAEPAAANQAGSARRQTAGHAGLGQRRGSQREFVIIGDAVGQGLGLLCRPVKVLLRGESAEM
jgi:hypothetical protein